MPEPRQDSSEIEALAADLTARVCQLVGSVVALSLENAESDFEHLLARSENLYQRKQGMLGTKSETRDLLVEIVFSRLRRTFRSFARSGDGRDEMKAAEWVLGAVVGGSAMAEFAAAIDSVILRCASPQDYSFAGRADFINLEDVLQMLGSGKQQGRLSLEKRDNRIDLYLQNGAVAFLDPHRLARRVLPNSRQMSFREISAEQLRVAEVEHARDGMPLVLSLHQQGCFRGLDLRSVIRQLGTEVLFEFLAEQNECNFFYRQLDQLPELVTANKVLIGVTPLLLEGSKRLDDWKQLRRVFPDVAAPIQPVPDIHQQISHLTLGVLEIKLLSQINGENSPRALSELIGLPLFDTCQMLLTFAREGAIVAPGGIESLQEVETSVEESMQIAFDALDANEDNVAVSTALDRVLGGAGGLFGGGQEEEKVSLDFLKRAKSRRR